MASVLTEVTAWVLPDATAIQESLRDPALFAVVYDRYAAQLYRYAGSRLGAEIAEDVVGETFAAAFADRAKYDAQRAEARLWLFGILSKKIADHRRRERARYRAFARVPGERLGDTLDDRVAADVTARAVRGRLAAALRRLSPGDREVLLLIAWADLSYGEVATALCIPLGTVRSRLNRARRKVRDALGGIDPTQISEELT
jgi:RNA polymerase sigma-70 factor (ECF subfamily)